MNTLDYIQIAGVYDKGDHSKERVQLRISGECNLIDFAVIDSTFVEDGQISDLNRHFYWFPSYKVNGGDYVLLYSKPGKNRSYTDKDGDKIHLFYWGLENTVWNKDGDCVTVLQLNGFKMKKIT